MPQLTRDPRYDTYYREALAIAEDKSRIPTGDMRDGWLYNFWQDDAHVHGLWRRARLDSYQTASPEWQSVLDVQHAQREALEFTYLAQRLMAPSPEQAAE